MHVSRRVDFNLNRLGRGWSSLARRAFHHSQWAGIDAGTPVAH